MSVLAWTRNAALALVFAALVVGLSPAGAQTNPFFRIGTGGTAATYFPIGGLIAHAISNPPGSRACADGGSCGVPGLVAIALATNASVANIKALEAGTIEAGFSQSDIAHWAYGGTGVFEGRGKFPELRAIANLYSETMHLVARKGAGISTVADLRGRRVSLDEPGSGTLIDARIVLDGYGLAEKDVEAAFLKPDLAGEKLRAGELDAFFFFGGFPVEAIAELASSAGIELIPIFGPQADKILADYPFFVRDRVPAGAYAGVPETPTLSVNAVLVTHAGQPDDLIYAITKALWNENSRKLLDSGHAKGRMIRKETATQGLGLPLHRGAERFYREAGLLAGTR